MNEAAKPAFVRTIVSGALVEGALLALAVWWYLDTGELNVPLVLGRIGLAIGASSVIVAVVRRKRVNARGGDIVE